MKPRNLPEANELVLRFIEEADEQMILGFLPLAESEEEFVLRVIREYASRPNVTALGLLRAAPAATAYAMAVAPSRTLTEGGHFWPALNNDLGLNVPSNRRSDLSAKFRLTCCRLGLLDGTIEEARWIYAAPFIYQAGILHYWKDDLASGVRAALRHVPPPDIDDDLALGRFAQFLGSRIHGQVNLQRILQTEVGPLLVRRLVTAYLRQEWSVLPPHLQEPIRNAFADSGRGATLRSPFLAYDAAFGEMRVVLPAQSGRLASIETYWQIGERRFPARREHSIPTTEIGENVISIGLFQLMSGFTSQTFEVETALNSSQPFRIFREDTGRERRFAFEEAIELSPGDYYVVTIPGITTNDEDLVTERDGFREVRLEIRPGDDPFVLEFHEQRWAISASLRQGMYVDRSRADLIVLEDGELLHFGDDLGLIAYFPANRVLDEKFTLTLRFDDSDDQIQSDLPSGTGRADVFIFKEDLQSSISGALQRLTPGIHRVLINVAHSAGRVDHALWYWKGLRRVSSFLGFECTTLPENINFHRSRGIVLDGSRIVFAPDYFAPFVTISLSNSPIELVMPRAGVHVQITEPGAEWKDGPSPDEAIVVGREDRRVLRFQSGGFQRWEIRGGDRVIAMLDKHRTHRVVSLSGLVAELGGSGRIHAKSDEGLEIPLISFSKPLTATALSYNLDHAISYEVWEFSIPTDELYQVGVKVVDLTEAPNGKDAEIVSIAERQGESFATTEYHHIENVVRFRVECGSKLEEIHFGNDIGAALGQALALQGSNEIGSVKISTSIWLRGLEDKLLDITFFRRSEAEDDWLPLDCVERYGYSKIRLLVWGPTTPPSDVGWWRRLKHEGMRDNEYPDHNLPHDIANLKIEELRVALRKCCELLEWKYPSQVWSRIKSGLQALPRFLAAHRFDVADKSAAVWWDEGVREILAHARSREAPVVRSFLFGAQPRCLAIPRRFVRMGRGREFGSILGQCLNFPAWIRNANSVTKIILSAFDDGKIDQEIIPCYRNFVTVQTGVDPNFRDFNLRQFLRGGVAGIRGLEKRVEELHETGRKVSDPALFSPAHLMSAIRRLNFRSHPLDAASNREAGHPLSRTAQALERISQNLAIVAPSIAEKIGWLDPGGSFWWRPPLLECRWGEKIAAVAWIVAALSRLTANSKMSHDEFSERLSCVLCPDGRNEADLANRLNILLSFGPELFAFYIALFELRFPVNRD